MVNLDHSRETYAVAIGGTFGALAVFNFVPIINLIGILPTFKEILIATAVSVVLLDTGDYVDSAAFTVITGMIAAVLVNIVRVALTLLGIGISGMGQAAGGTGAEEVAGGMALGGIFAGFGILISLIGVVIFSPIGYAIGGVIGAFVNGQ